MAVCSIKKQSCRLWGKTFRWNLLAKVKMWYEGPKFLWEPESSRKRHHTVEEIDTDDPETKKEVFVNRIEVKSDILETLETRFSSWNKMRRVLALVLKFKTNLIKKAFPKRHKTELHQQIGTSEQLSSIAEIETAGEISDLQKK